MPDDFDKRFEELLGPAAARALAQWAAAMGLSFRLNRVFVNGRSTATVAAVYERSPGKMARKLILKHDIVTGEDVASGEFARQREAIAAAGPFRPHLTGLAHEPIGVGDDSWITFQEIAGGTLDEAHVLTSLLAAVPGISLPGIRTEDIHSDHEAFVRACSTVVGQMLGSWALTPDLEHPPLSAFLRSHLADRVAPGRALAELARRWPGPTITLDGETGSLPNPFSLILDPSPRLNIDVPAIIGKGHGDLHTENILIQPDQGTFWLIDLSRYRSDAPLTQDPIQLLLSIVNRTLGGLTDRQRETLLHVLTAPATHEQWAELPVWLSALIQSTRTACLSWIAPSGLSDEWRQATTLSTLACALIFAARPSTSIANRAWLLRLAARSAATFIDDGTLPQPRGSRPPKQPEANHLRDCGLARLCAVVWHLREHARKVDRTSEVDSLVSQARLGHDIRFDLDVLAGDLGVEVTRSGSLPHVLGQATAVEIYGCPLAVSCDRTDRRQPSGPEPFCHIVGEPMTRTMRSL